MKLLLDTHAFFWWVTDDPRLPAHLYDAIANSDTEVLLSAVVPWELATKGRSGKWPGATAALDELDPLIGEEGLTPLPITLAHAKRAGQLEWSHRDPFDRLLAAQTELEGAMLVTGDALLLKFDVDTVWS